MFFEDPALLNDGGPTQYEIELELEDLEAQLNDRLMWDDYEGAEILQDRIQEIESER